MSVTFAQLGVPEHICRALERCGFVRPFEIQAATIADALAGRDVCGRAPTGSGKTVAFGVPLIATVGRAQPRRPRGLVLVPTRELAEQITEELATFAGDVRLISVYGGVGYRNQVRDLQRGVEVVVACPGRLEDLINQGAIDLSSVDRVVVDEADQMADMGFLPVVRRLLNQTADSRQTLLFSATLDDEVAALTRQYQRDPVHHRVEDDGAEESTAQHYFWLVDRDDRVDVGARVIERAWPAMVFCRTRHGADRVARQLARHGVDTVSIHGGHSQSKRTRALDRFTAGKAQALVATDVAARGIHVDGVAAVLHFDVPADHKTYVHRSGRTARAGEGGLVVTLVLPSQVKEMRKIQSEIELVQPIGPPAVDELVAPDRPKPKPKPARVDQDRDRGQDRAAGSADRAGSRRQRPSGRPSGRPGKPSHRATAERATTERPTAERTARGGKPGHRTTSNGTAANGTTSERAASGRTGADRRSPDRAAAGDENRTGGGERNGGADGASRRAGSSTGPKRSKRRATSGRSGKPRPADKAAARAGTSRGKPASRTARKRSPND